MKHILLTGQPKTGTTGLYNLVKQGLQPLSPEYYFMFEPRTAARIRSVVRKAPHLNVMAKMMFGELVKTDLGRQLFDRRAMTVRDPRDTLISNLLFKPLVRGVSDSVSMDEHERFLAALEAKERDPSCWSVTGLAGLAFDVGYKGRGFEGQRNVLDGMVDYVQGHDLHLVRYEEFVEGRVDALADYLGVPLDPGLTEGSVWLEHISRSRSHGAWRHWFTAEDVERCRPVYGSFLASMGYADDWELAPDPVIDPATSSEHVRRNLAKRHAELGALRRAGASGKPAADAGDGGETIEGRDLQTLWSMADDGNPHASLALARQLGAGMGYGPGWDVSARHWAGQARLQALPGAAELYAELGARVTAARRPRPTAEAATAEAATAEAATAEAATAQAATAAPKAAGGPSVRRRFDRLARRARRKAARARRWVRARTGS